MRSSLKDIGADVWSRERTCGPSRHGGRTAPNPDVRPECDKEILFSPTVPQLLFFLLQSYFGRSRTNKRFSIDLENPDQSKYSETLFDPSEFLTHIMLNVTFSCTTRLFCVPTKHAYFITLIVILVAHELWYFEKNILLNMLIKWDL